MPIPSYAETLGASLGPDITIITDGKLFEESDEDMRKLDIGAINAELAKVSGSDGIIFETPEPPKEDIPFQTFVAEQRALTHH
jgi:hypothetical protein